MDEVVYNVFGDEFKGVRESNELSHWTVEDVVRWIGTLQFLGTRRDLIASRVRDECITGQVMRDLTQQQWISRISLDFREYKLIDLSKSVSSLLGFVTHSPIHLCSHLLRFQCLTTSCFSPFLYAIRFLKLIFTYATTTFSNHSPDRVEAR